MVVEKPMSEPDDLVDLGSIAASSQEDGPYGDSMATSDAESYQTASARSDTDADSGPKKTRFGLFSKIVILMLAVSLIPLGVYWFITFNKTSNLARVSTENLMAQTALGLSNQVDEWIDKNVRVLKAAARLPGIISMDRPRQEPALKAIQKEYPWIYLAFTVDLKGMNTARGDGKSLKNYSDRQYYKDVAIKGKKLTWQTLIGKTSKKPALVLAVPIVSGGRTIGVMAAAANIDDISKSVARWRQGKTGYAFLVDETGKVVSHQVKRFVVQQKKLTNHPMVQAYKRNKRAQAAIYKDERGREVFGQVRGNRYDWALVVRQESEEIFEPLKSVQLFFYILLIVTILVVSAVAWVFARALVQPIMKLTDIAERMSLGELDNKIDVKAKDEIGLLAMAIERMRISLNMAMARLRKKR